MLEQLESINLFTWNLPDFIDALAEWPHCSESLLPVFIAANCHTLSGTDGKESAKCVKWKGSDR